MREHLRNILHSQDVQFQSRCDRNAIGILRAYDLLVPIEVTEDLDGMQDEGHRESKLHQLQLQYLNPLILILVVQ